MSIPEAAPTPVPAAAPGPAPPVVIYVPSIRQSAANSTTRIAQILAKLSNDGPGSYTTKTLPTDVSKSKLSEAQRISKLEGGQEPILDLFTYDYRPRLESISNVAGSGVGGAVKRLAFALVYFVRALLLVLGARRRAKSTIAKVQLVIGFGAVVVLLASVLLTAATVLVALGVWDAPASAANGTAADAIAIGATAFTTWLIASLRPHVSRASMLLQQLLDYAERDRYAAGVGGGLGAAIDEILEEDASREIHVVAYSLGALVAMDWLFPRASDQPRLDLRHVTAIRTLTTIGSPLDFVRLFIPAYAERRVARAPNVRWKNVFIAADVLGSNFIDDLKDDGKIGTDGKGLVAVADVSPALVKYTSERLTWRNIWGYRGFFSHAGYWDEVEHGHCLNVVHEAVLA